MKCKLVKLSRFSGDKASIYSVIVNNDNQTLFDKFIEENKISFINEITNILNRLKTIGNKTGARKDFFKEFEGNPGDGVCALYDIPGSNLRLYCIKYGTELIVIGGGGPKPKNFRSLQQDEKLTKENYFLRWLSTEIYKKRKDKEIFFINDCQDFTGDLEFYDDETN
jgi:hypothetical protein